MRVTDDVAHARHPDEPALPDHDSRPAATVVGEMKNLLAVVIAYAQLLRRDPTIPAAHAADLAALEGAAHEAAALVCALLPRSEA